MIDFTSEENNHRYASWCAGTASSSSPKCRFKISEAEKIISKTDLKSWGRGWRFLPPPDQFDRSHRFLREEMISEAKNSKINGFTHGVAAKIINIYLKTIYIVQPEPVQKYYEEVFHPPIDRELMKGMKNALVGGKKQPWSRFENLGWSNFSSDDYETVIESIRTLHGPKLWTVEKYWIGYQS